MELGARVWARARPKLALDLVMRPGRVVTDQVVKNAHVAIDGLEKLLLILLHLTLEGGLLGHELFPHKLLHVFFDDVGQGLKVLLGHRDRARYEPRNLFLEAAEALLLLPELLLSLLIQAGAQGSLQLLNLLLNVIYMLLVLGAYLTLMLFPQLG